MKTVIIGAGSDLGVHIDGAHLGPVQLMNDIKGFYQGEQNLFLQDNDILKSRNLSDRRKNEYEIDNFNTTVYNAIVEKMKQDFFPILIGGDHSVAAASALASAKIHQNIGIIWFDAHADYNTFDTTVSGNMHGLTLAAITGYKNHELRYFHDGNIIQTSKAVIVGARSIDPWEKDNLKYSGITVFLVIMDLQIAYWVWDLTIYSNVMYLTNTQMYVVFYAIFVIAMLLMHVYAAIKEKVYRQKSTKVSLNDKKEDE